MTSLSYPRLQPKAKYQEYSGKCISVASRVVTLDLTAYTKNLQPFAVSIIAMCLMLGLIWVGLPRGGGGNLPLGTEQFMSLASKRVSAASMS